MRLTQLFFVLGLVIGYIVASPSVVTVKIGPDNSDLANNIDDKKNDGSGESNATIAKKDDSGSGSGEGPDSLSRSDSDESSEPATEQDISGSGSDSGLERSHGDDPPTTTTLDTTISSTTSGTTTETTSTETTTIETTEGDNNYPDSSLNKWYTRVFWYTRRQTTDYYDDDRVTTETTTHFQDTTDDYEGPGKVCVDVSMNLGKNESMVKLCSPLYDGLLNCVLNDCMAEETCQKTKIAIGDKAYSTSVCVTQKMFEFFPTYQLCTNITTPILDKSTDLTFMPENNTHVCIKADLKLGFESYKVNMCQLKPKQEPYFDFHQFCKYHSHCPEDKKCGQAIIMKESPCTATFVNICVDASNVDDIPPINCNKSAKNNKETGSKTRFTTAQPNLDLFSLLKSVM